MLTSYIEAQANRDNLATGDLDPRIILRHKVIPDYLDDLGEVGWRRKYYTFSTVAGTPTYAMPSTFAKAYSVIIPATASNAKKRDIEFIGDNSDRVSAAEVATTQVAPTGYYVVQDSSSNWKKLKFEQPPDGIYSVVVTYWLYLLFADDTSAVDLTTYMPEQIQWPLVEGLRRYILQDRFGVGDSRYQTADANYREGVERALGYAELAPQRFAVFAR